MENIKGMQAGQVSPFRNALSSFWSLEAKAEFIPPADRLIIPDISGWQADPDHPVNFVTMKAEGASGVFIKATQGVTGIDDQYTISRDDVDGILPWGSYHYVTTSNGVLQADNFLAATGGRIGVLPSVLDVEQASLSAEVIKACAQRIEERTGNLPYIYTSVYYYGKVYNPAGSTAKKWISDHLGLWVAHWGTEYPSLPYGWAEYKLHQYTARGVGIEYDAPPPPYGAVSIDLSYCHGDWLAEFTQQDVVPLEERVSHIEDLMRDHGWDV